MEKLPHNRIKTALHIYATKEELQEINDYLEYCSQTPLGKVRLGDVLRLVLLGLSKDKKIK